MTWEEIDRVLSVVKVACDVLPLSLETHEKATEIARRYHLSFYDALICAAALLAGVDQVLSEDMQDGMRVDGLIIGNPFKSKGGD